MNVNFIGQGYKPGDDSSVFKALKQAFADKSFSSFKCLVAFASPSGVTGLREIIEESKDHINTIRIIVGIDQHGTSKEALEALIEWNVDVYIYYTAQTIIFHPKIYLFEGDDKALAIVGSNNLTQAGLVRNIEGSFKVEYLKEEVDPPHPVEQITNYYAPLLDEDAPNIQKLTSELIDTLVEAGKVKDEAFRRKQHLKSNDPAESNDEEEEALKEIEGLFPSIPLKTLPEGFKPKVIKAKPAAAAEEVDEDLVIELEKGDLAWRKRNLPASDVLYAPPGTNPTGGLRLVQAGYEVNNTPIDQTTYFRNNVFNDEDWAESGQNPFRESVTLPFQIIIQGDLKGVFDLIVRHKPSGEAGQGNYTTSLSWGEFSPIIRATDLRGLTLELYKRTGPGEPYTILID